MIKEFLKPNKKNVLVFIALGVLLISASIIGILFFYTYTVSGKITDLANKKPISNVEVSIDNAVGRTNKDGLFQIKNIKIYQREALKIEAPASYEEITPISLNYSKRDIIQNIEIAPTLKTMVSRLNVALRNSQYDYLWDYMHADDQQYWESKKNYVETFKKRVEIGTELGFSAPEYKIEKNIRKLDTWKHEVTKKEYVNVMEIPVEVKSVYDNEKQTQINLQYWQKVDRVWRYFTQSNKEKTKQQIEAYEELKEIFSE